MILSRTVRRNGSTKRLRRCRQAGWRLTDRSRRLPGIRRWRERSVTRCANALIPCHRVVNAKGELSGAFAFGKVNTQEKLLAAEGIALTDGRVDLDRYGIDSAVLHQQCFRDDGGGQ